jgi:uncharacterized protein YlzI (FlbEa/FlbD family)
MIIEEIQLNIIKAQRSLEILERGIIYKIYKTFGHLGEFEKDLRAIYNKLIDVRNKYITHVEAIIRLTENKDLLTLIDSGYFEQFSNVMSTQSMFRITSFNGFNIPETSLKVISENKSIVNEMNSIIKSIFDYNEQISVFRQNRNKYYITLYRIPPNRMLPDVINSTVSIETLLPVSNVLSSRSNQQLTHSGKKFMIKQGITQKKTFRINR